MYCCLFLLGTLLFYTGESFVQGPPEPVLAFAGGDAVLPCSFEITTSNDFPTVEWSKEGLKPNVIFLYRDGCETHEMKNPAFEYRTSLIARELKNGNVSLRISDVQLSDAGKYQCKRLWKDPPREVTTVELVVVAVSEPKLSVVSAEKGGVTLQCEAGCWLPKPEIKFLDHEGNEIPAEEPKRERDQSGCDTVRQRVTVQSATNRVTCRVHQPEFNHTKHIEILIPAECTRSHTQMIGIAVGGTILFFLVTCGAVLLGKRCGKPGKRNQPMKRQESDQSTFSTADKHCPLLVQQNTTDEPENGTVQKLKSRVADLESELHMKDETIRQLQSSLESQQRCDFCQLDPVKQRSESSNSPAASSNTNPTQFTNFPQVIGQNPSIQRPISNPTPDRPPHRRLRINSSPAVFHHSSSKASLSAAAEKKRQQVQQLSSVFDEQQGQNGVLLQRRHSLVLPKLYQPVNHYRHLANLPEVSESLY
uniref:Butyrophilin subfamily 3 member A2-like n=1 Tax=Acanthochromis polyacanthus TaxID=80966 RepID=A0A3Q1FE78_9TELE